jgi:uncharacterized repeat protein (TIGR01451 family)
LHAFSHQTACNCTVKHFLTKTYYIMKIPKKLLIPLLLLFSISVFAQNATPFAELNGVRLKKVVSDTSIPTGQTFSYSLYISVPAGLDSIRVFDNLPTGLVFHSISAIPATLGTPAVTTPAAGNPGTVSLRWAPTTTALNGMITVTVSFPNGVTCNGATASNQLNAEWWVNRVYFKTNTATVRTRAIAVNPWRIEKKVVGLPNVGASDTCTFRSDTTLIRYRIRVYKTVGLTGQLNLVGGVVTDVLPPGAVLITPSPCFTQSGNTLTWNVGNLSALPNFTYVDCDFSVQYPSGTTIANNTATLTGSLGPQPPATSCGTFSISSSVCTRIIPPTPGGVFNKAVSTTGQPGCGGRYVISARNTGTSPATLTIRDTVPSNLIINSVAASPAGSLTINILPGNIVTATSNSPLNPTQVVSLIINFTISSTTPLGTNVTNCAYDTLTSTAGTVAGRPCVTFNTNVPGARACVWKEVCAKQPSYTIGSVFRYRLRVQNTGGLALTGVSVTDVLSPNLAFVGNVSADSSRFWNTPCTNTTGGDWAGVTHLVSGNTVTFTLPAIQPTCQDVFYNNCGAYGSPLVPFYFIEFDVKVVDTAALGNTPNAFVLTTNELSATSNTDLVNIVGSLGIGATKEVSADGSTWGSSATSTPGATISYRLRSNITVGSVGLRYMSFVDLLPRNNNSVSDHFILTPCGNRGSAFDVSYVAPISTIPAATGFNNAGTYADVDLFNPTPFAGPLFSGCGTSTNAWNTGIGAGDRNLGYYFDYAGIGSGSPATASFSAKIASTAAANTVACNSFALIGFVKYLFNTSSTATTNFVAGLPVESGPACVTVTDVPNPCIDKLAYKIECLGKNTAGNQQYAIDISGSATDPSTTGISISSTQGTLNPNNFTVSAGGFVLNTVFTDVPPVNNPIMIYLTVYNDRGKICIDSMEVKLPECVEEKDCCTGFIHKFFDESVAYDVEKDQVYLTGCVQAGPARSRTSATPL